MHAGDIRHHGGHFFARLLKSLQVVPKNLERQRTLSARHCFSNVILDGLREVPDRARILLHRATHGRYQFFFITVEHWSPLVLRLQVNEILGVTEAASVGSVIGTAHLGDHGFHFRKRRENIAFVVGELLAFRKTGTVGQSSPGPDRSFIEMRQELRANYTAKGQEERPRQGRDPNPGDDPAIPHRPAQSLAVACSQIIHHPVAPFMDAFAEKYSCQHRCDENGKRHRTQQSQRDCPGHGPEEPTLNPLQREDRQIGRNDDGNRIKDWPLHLVRGLTNRFGGRFLTCRSGTVVQAAHVANDVFDHDHRAVHYHSEVQRPERKKVRRNVAEIQPDGGKQQRERNRERDDECRTHIQQKQEKNDAHQNHAFDKVMHHCVQGEVKQVAAIQHGNNLHAGRQDAVVQLVHFLVNGVERGLLLGAFAHQHTTLNDVGLVDDAAVFHVIGSRHVTQPDFGALADFSDIFHSQRGPGLGFQHSLLDVLHAAKEPESTNIHLLHSDFNETAAGIDIVVGELLLHLADAQSIGNQLVRIDANLVLAYRAPEVGNIHHVRYRFELLEQNPIFDRSEFHQVIAGIGASQCVPVDLARGAPVGADLRLQVLAGRQIHLRKAFQHLLAIPVVDRAVVEDHDDERQAENRLGSQKSHVRHSRHLDLDWNRDLLLHLFRRAAGPLRNDRHVVVGDIGVSFHWQVVE